MTTNEVRVMANLLSEASAAHNEYEQRELGGLYDKVWSNWYARYLVNHGIGDLLGETITAEALAVLLARYDIDYRAQQRPESWPEYYAAHLLERHVV